MPAVDRRPKINRRAAAQLENPRQLFDLIEVGTWSGKDLFHCPCCERSSPDIDQVMTCIREHVNQALRDRADAEPARPAGRIVLTDADGRPKKET